MNIWSGDTRPIDPFISEDRLWRLWLKSISATLNSDAQQWLLYKQAYSALICYGAAEIVHDISRYEPFHSGKHSSQLNLRAEEPFLTSMGNSACHPGSHRLTLSPKLRLETRQVSAYVYERARAA